MEQRVELLATTATDNVVVARLTGLKPGATADYRVEAGADRAQRNDPRAAVVVAAERRA